MSNFPITPEIITDAAQNQRTNYIGFVSFTILIWDHIITFPDEVELIWKGSKGPLVWLFLLNRYLTPLGFTLNIFAYLSPVWTPEVCDHFVRFEGSMTVIGVEVVALMMLLRVHAIYYYRNKWAVYLVAGILVGETVVNAWLLTHAIRVPHTDPDIHSCTMIFDPAVSDAASASAWIPLLYDTIIFSLTLHATLPSIRHKQAGHIIRRLFEDGLLYYSVICSITVVLTIMIIAAPPGLKNITAQLELLLTVAMMSRITLNLKRTARDHSTLYATSVDAAQTLPTTRGRSLSNSSQRLGRLRSASGSGSGSVGRCTSLTFDVTGRGVARVPDLSPVESTESLHAPDPVAVAENGALLHYRTEQFEMEAPKQRPQDRDLERKPPRKPRPLDDSLLPFAK
ncbi:hypothetical protein PLICRDRAFT_43617 [Plicaturopsis crispa FD-325 SS-3]|nr:hypothetical protein PLICRDRAFT_43617 [Plicaturopsis crispa FD-325 SS-3]